MSQIRNYIYTVLFAIGLISSAQNVEKIDQDALELSLQEQLGQAKLLTDRGDYYNAKDHLTKALDITLLIKDRKTEGIIHTKLAKLQYLVEEPKKAIASITKAAQIQRDIGDLVNLGLTYNIRGVIHSNQKEYKTALEYFKSAISNFREANQERYEAEVNLNEARVHIKLKNLQAAQNKLEHAIVLAKKYNQNRVLSSSYIQNARVYCMQEEYDAALEQAQAGLDIGIEHSSTENINDAYFTLSKIYQGKKNYQSANMYLTRHLELSDSILSIQRENLSPEKSVQYVRAYKNAENQQLKNQITEADTDNSLSRITTILSISLITILSLLTLSLYKNNNIRLKTNNMLQIKNDELVVAKEKAELASKTKANFLSTVTHELRTPLYAVTGLTNLLLDEAPKKSQIPHLKSLKFSGDYLLTFINDILQINKIEANKVELDPEQFNLKKKIENVIAALSNSANDNNIRIHYNYENNLPKTFLGDQLKISQILINLLGNAIKFTKDGDIWVRVNEVRSKGKDYTIRFEIEDNGIGISKEKQEQMFDSFSQGSIQINRKYGGTGLGLSIVKGLIKILKGKIWLKSKLGHGSTFIFEIPLVYMEPKKEIVKAESEHLKNIKTLDLNSIRILVVEDNKINQMITKKILNKMGLQCDIIDNGEDAVDMVKANAYSVVLMDIHMPGISGLEATRRIRKFDEELTIFALTAVTLEDKMHEFEEAGFDDIISKPFKQETFEEKLYIALSEKEITETDA